MKPLLSVNKLKIKFGEKVALKGISFTIYEGETVGLIGESGSGKSLTASALMGLLPQSAICHGSAIYKEANLLSFSLKQWQPLRGKEISLILQDPGLALNPIRRLGDQLIEGMIHHLGLTRKEAWLQGIEWMKKVEIQTPEMRMSQYPHEISGGMKQRILIAMALACSPSLVLADEPTTALDASIQIQIIRMLKKMQTELNTALLFITHDLSLAAIACDRLLVMHKGEIVEAGPAASILKHPQHPYTQLLMRARELKR